MTSLPRLVAGIGGLVLIAVILWDAFEVVILPRRVTRRFRLARVFFRSTWAFWRSAVRALVATRRRETFLSYYGPLSLIVLLMSWAVLLVFAFALVQWALGPSLRMTEGEPNFGAALYMSGTTFFTLGLGDITPRSALARVVTVVEAGIGFLFLAVIIAYLPVVYQSFSRREVSISLLDARAGSPPTARELLRRHAHDPQTLLELLRDWERWAAELLESHLSYPVLCYFRSQHDNQSWVAALTVILDTSAFVLVSATGHLARQARLTFAIARHAVIDLTQVMRARPLPPSADRLLGTDLVRLRGRLAESGTMSEHAADTDRELSELRAMYEPYVNALARRLEMELPPWTIDAPASDNWQRSAWDSAPALDPEDWLDLHDHDDD